jgi:hypothetical protein
MRRLELFKCKVFLIDALSETYVNGIVPVLNQTYSCTKSQPPAWMNFPLGEPDLLPGPSSIPWTVISPGFKR